MPKRLVVANYKTGYETDLEPFLVNNDAFPILQDAYLFVGKARRKRGTLTLGRLQRTVSTTQTITGGTTSLVATVSFPSGAPEATVVSEGISAHVDFAITGATQANPCVLTIVGNTFVANQFVTISDVVGMTELNGNTYEITNVLGAAVTINVDSTGFTAYSSGGTASVYGQIYRTITGITNANPAVVTSNGHNIPDGSTVLITGVSGIYPSFTITGATNSNPLVVTANNTAARGDAIMFSGITGMVGLNGLTLYVIDVTPTTMILQADSTNFGPYISGGTALDVSQNPLNLQTFTTSGATANTFAINIDTTSYSPYLASGTVSTLTDLLTGSNTIQFDPAFSGDSTVNIDIEEYMNLPVMGIEDYEINQALAAPSNVFFDTTYAYQFDSGTKTFFDVSFYKATKAPVVWSGASYNQFWSTNFQGAFWATNSVPGFHVLTISSVTVGNPTTITTSTNHNLSAASDLVFINELTGADAGLLNGMTFTATKTGANTFTVPVNTTAKTITAPGIVQLLTRSLAGAGDGIRWYDGQNFPTEGWVNFMPPLSSATNPYYLTGALMIYPYKDRLLFFNCTVQNSAGNIIKYIDMVIFSQNGTCYYANAPLNQSSDPQAFWTSPAGRGGYARTGLNQQLVSVAPNEDLLIVGSEFRKVRLIYTNVDANPILFDTINIEFTTTATFSAISLDIGVLDIGTYGITLTTPASSARVDLPIFQQIFDDFQEQNNGYQRICGIRDWFNEYIYWSYLSSTSPTQWLFPTRTLAYNYRDRSWAYFIESYTHYGYYRPSTALTWGTYNATWGNASTTWGYGGSLANFPDVACGNQQGFINLKDATGTGEAPSRYIGGITINATNTTINSPDHCLRDGDFIYIQGLIGIGGLNGTIQQVILIQSSPGVYDKDNFNVGIVATGTYGGGGLYTIIPDPVIRTKSFNAVWDQGQKTRFGTQRFFMTRAPEGQVSIANYVNQDYGNDINSTPVDDNLANLANNILITDSEVSTNTPSSSSQQIWHRMSNSFWGDTIATEIYLSNAQKTDPSLQIQFAEIEMQAFVMDVYPGPNLDYYLS